jgi:hypothetical protein
MRDVAELVIAHLPSFTVVQIWRDVPLYHPIAHIKHAHTNVLYYAQVPGG